MGTHTITIEHLSQLLGVSRSHAYAMAKEGALPVPVIRIGQRRMVVSRRAVEDLLGTLDVDTRPAGEAA